MVRNPLFSLIFVNYRSAYQLALALRTLRVFEGEKESYEVIVVNNDVYESGVLQRLSRTFEFLLVENETNMGFGAAANRGALRARGSLLGFLNPDLIWCQPILGALEKLFQAESHEQLIGAALLDGSGRTDKQSRGARPWLGQLLWQNFIPLFPSPLASSLDWVSGGALFLQRQTFEQLRGFDQHFFLYFEDVDLCLRAQARGVQIVSLASLPLIHCGGKSFPSRFVQKQHFYRSQKQYYQKHRPAWEAQIVRLLHLIFHPQ
jgi:GT2 family glycosyltransferase